MDRQVLEKRMKMLGCYMGELCQTTIVNSHVGLKELLMSFLEQGEYDRATCGPIAATVFSFLLYIQGDLVESDVLDKYPGESYKIKHEEYSKCARAFNKHRR